MMLDEQMTGILKPFLEKGKKVFFDFF